ncbi:MAG TPA: cohesin domain-containing protein [Candidatus Polarisedimenticolaceae bacterium]|nr:cohesin domain-containing protein [Candidatus Polarisedimenticolaceae bacterium]
MTIRLPLLAAVLTVLVTACGGSSTSTTSAPSAHFTADTPSPGPYTVALAHASANGAAVTIKVTVTGVPSFFGAAFHITYDPDALLFGSWDYSSSFLSQGLVSPGDVFFSEDHTTIGGTMVVVATRVDPTVESPVDVTTTSTLFTVTFIARKAIAAGAADGRVDFGDPKQVCDGTVNPPGCNPITVTWSGGGLSAK